MIDALFTYGSLEYAEIMRIVTGRRYASLPAELADHARRLMPDGIYPGIVPAAGERVRGTLYRGIDAETFAILDAFDAPVPVASRSPSTRRPDRAAHAHRRSSTSHSACHGRRRRPQPGSPRCFARGTGRASSSSAGAFDTRCSRRAASEPTRRTHPT